MPSQYAGQYLSWSFPDSFCWAAGSAVFMVSHSWDFMDFIGQKTVLRHVLYVAVYVYLLSPFENM